MHGHSIGTDILYLCRHSTHVTMFGFLSNEKLKKLRQQKAFLASSLLEKSIYHQNKQQLCHKQGSLAPTRTTGVHMSPDGSSHGRLHLPDHKASWVLIPKPNPCTHLAVPLSPVGLHQQLSRMARFLLDPAPEIGSCSVQMSAQTGAD